MTASPSGLSDSTLTASESSDSYTAASNGTPGGTRAARPGGFALQLFDLPLAAGLLFERRPRRRPPNLAELAVEVLDHVKHDWDAEARRAFREYQACQSLFGTLRQQDPPPPTIRFAGSFWLHEAMAAFLTEDSGTA